MTIKVIYETQTGTTQYVADLLKRELSQVGHQVQFHSIKYNGLQPDLNGTDLVILAAPTYDDGYLEKNMREFTDKVALDLSKYKVAVIGLGNHTYPLFCKAADALELYVLQNQGSFFVQTLRLDGFPDNLQPFMDWIANLIQKIAPPAEKIS